MRAINCTSIGLFIFVLVKNILVPLDSVWINIILRKSVYRQAVEIHIDGGQQLSKQVPSYVLSLKFIYLSMFRMNVEQVVTNTSYLATALKFIPIPTLRESKLSTQIINRLTIHNSIPTSVIRYLPIVTYVPEEIYLLATSL